METRVKSFVKVKQQDILVDLFGYSSHGIPGIEICGITGPSGRILKEKLIYFSKISKVKFPLKRFVLCLEVEGKVSSQLDFQQIELPFLILLWTMAGVLKIRNLEQCLSLGRIDVSGRIFPEALTEGQYRVLKASDLLGYRLIGVPFKDIPCLQVHEIMKVTPEIRTVFPVG